MSSFSIDINEIDFEKSVAEGPKRLTPSALPQLISDMSDVGAPHITDRRLNDTLGGHAVAEIPSNLALHAEGLWSLDELSASLGR